MKQINPDDTIAIGFSVQYALDEGKAISFSSCLDAECDPAVLNAALDKMTDAAERQAARLKAPKLKQEVERLERAHERAKEDIFRLEAEESLADANWRASHTREGRRGEFRLSPAQVNERNKRQADKQNAQITFARMEEEIGFRKAELAKIEGVIDAASSAANSNSSLPNC